MNAPIHSELERLRVDGLASLYPSRVRIAVGMATCGQAAGAQAVYEAIQAAAAERGLDLLLVATGCLGYCQQEPLVDVRLPSRRRAARKRTTRNALRRVLYHHMTPDRARQLVNSLADGQLPLDHALGSVPEEAPPGAHAARGLPWLDELPFYAKQHKIILRNSGLIDPLRIEEYIARGGYQGLVRALSDLTAARVIQEVTRSGLRGRGGAGYPTGLKWQICHDVPRPPRYLVCNGDEGDPGAYMDRTVLESDPYSVIEGMTIAAYAIGAATGYVYVRDEYPLAVEHVTLAVARARELGWLGKNILGSGFDLDLEVVRGAGAFVCGEETALIASIEGGLGEPRPKPPFPATCGLWGQPTIINNVKTLASVPQILSHGAEAYAAVGSPGNAGTVVFSLVGKVANTGLVEVPLGLSLRDLVEGIGGGLDGSQVKAVQTGGPSGGCLPERLFDLPIDYQALTQAGSIMGSGGMVVMDENTCMVDVARYFLDFTMSESCGKCTPCREGIRYMYDILTRIAGGTATEGDLEQLVQVAEWVKAASLCGLGQTAPNPVLSTLRYFRDEYEAHVKDKRCPAGICRGLIRLTIQAEACNGCDICRRECPAEAVRGDKQQVHFIDQERCVRCRVCYDVCPTGAVEIIR